jgi:hypothetical protein
MHGSQALVVTGTFRQQHCMVLKKTCNYIRSDSRGSAPTAHCSGNDMNKDMYRIVYVSVSNKILLNPHRPHAASRNHRKAKKAFSLGQRQEKCIAQCVTEMGTRKVPIRNMTIASR